MKDVAETLTFGRFRMDCKRCALLLDGNAVALHARAFDVLEFLVAHRERVVSRDEIVAHVWRGLTIGENNLSVQTSSLRRVLAEHGGGDLIITLPGRGYRFVGDIDSAQTAGDEARFAPPPYSIAVLAFTNLSGDPAQDYFSDGLSEELIDTLSRVRQLKVVARASSFYFKDKAATISEIARRLNVGGVLQGSVRRQGGRLRISAQLVDAGTGFQLWSKSFDRDQGDVLKIQEEIATAVSDALRVSLFGKDSTALTPGSSANPRAFDEFLRGVQAVRLDSAGSSESAVKHFDKALELDREFALAYSGRANALTLVGTLGVNKDSAAIRRVFAEALADADRGVALAPELGITHAARGWVLINGFLDFAGAMAELLQARALAPGSTSIELLYVTIAIAMGRIEEATEVATRVTELDPFRADGWWALAYVLHHARRYDAALNAFDHGRVIKSEIPAPFLAVLGYVSIAQGDSEAARLACADDCSPQTAVCLAISCHAAGRKGEAAAHLARLRVLVGENGAYGYAQILAQWRRPQQALRWLDKALKLMSSGLTSLATDPMLDPIRSCPAFEEIKRTLVNRGPHAALA